MRTRLDAGRCGSVVREWVTTVLVTLALAGSRLVAAEPALPHCDGREKELAAGQVIVIAEEPSGGRGVALDACGVIDAPPAQVWPVVRDCGSYDRFMPRVERSRLASRDGNVVVCDVVVALPFPAGELRSVTRVVETAHSDGGFERRWTLLHGTYRRNDGSWTLRPWPGDARRTLVVYRLDMEPDTFIPDFLLRRLQSETVREVFAAVRERVGRCASSAPPAGCAGGP